MSGEQGNYWSRMTQRRYSRRALMRGALLAGAGMTAAAALACRGATTTSSNSGKSPGGQSQAIQSSSSLSKYDSRSGTEPKGPPVKGGTLNYYITGNPPTLDPTQNVSVNTTNIAGASLSRLYRYKQPWDPVQSLNLETQPDLALTAESSDAITWTVKLRPNAKFQNIAPVNGHPVEAEDVKQSFIKATAPQAVNAGNLSYINPSQIQTPDKQTVVFKLNYPYAPFVSSGLASPFYSWIFPREVAGGQYDPAKKLIGSGPWILDSVTPDVAVTEKKNPDFYDSSLPNVDAVRVAIIPDASQRIAQFTGGHLHVLGSLLLQDVPSVKRDNPKAEWIHTITNGNGVMYYNLGDPKSPFQDVRLRQALALSVDRDAYAKASGFATGEYIQTFSVPPGVGKWAAMTEDYPPDTLQWYKYDPQKAKQLFDAAGGSKLNMKMIYPAGNPADPQLGVQGQTVFSMLKELPWNVSYVTVDYNREWINGGKGIGYPGGGVPAESMAWWGWSSRPTVDEYLYSFFYSKGAGNFMHVNDPKIDSMIDKARATLNEDDRVTAYKDVQRYIASQVYVLMGLVNGEGYTFISPQAQNYRLGDASAPGMAYWAQMWLTQ
jgi:peptide/nickel transport system substrate-binding protein